MAGSLSASRCWPSDAIHQDLGRRLSTSSSNHPDTVHRKMPIPGPGLRCGSVIRLMLLLSIHSLIAPRAAHAYVDPVSGSMIFQILAAGVIGAAFTTKRW